MSDRVAKVDWHVVIRDLEGQGMSHGYLADVLRVSRTAVLSWKNSGVEPLYDRGERLLLLWRAMMAVAQSDVPRKEVARM